MHVSAKERRILRDFAKEVADLASQPVMEERRRLWKQHNSLKPVRPMILLFPEGSWRELLPKESLQCEDESARGMEMNLRRRLYYAQWPDDTVIEADWVVNKAVHNTGWGLEPKRIPSPDALGAWAFDPVILEPADLKKLQHPVVEHDEQETQRRLESAQELFGGILEIKVRGVHRTSYHLMAQYTRLRGLEQVMMDMLENPGMLHDAMAFLEEGHRGILEQHMALNLLDLNNDGTYHSSGGNGYTEELPQPHFDPDRVRPCDMWASAEAQEMAQVSPDMHREFILDYEKRLMEPFGLNGYGCCEDLTRKLDDVFTIPNIRRISISPWADVDACAEKLQDKYIFSWKPNPSHLIGQFNPERIREYIRHALEACRGCVLEMILKDTHTCDHHPERFKIWTEIARGLVDSL